MLMSECNIVAGSNRSELIHVVSVNFNLMEMKNSFREKACLQSG